MPSILFGYQNRISPTYWSASSISWTGSVWTSAGVISGFSMTPQLAMGATGSVRMLMKLNGIKKLLIDIDGVTHSHQYVLAGRSNEIAIARFAIAVGQTFTATLDTLSAVEIDEIEVGFVGTF